MEALHRLLGTDQPGRLLAVFVIAPILLYKGLVQHRDWFITLFAVILFLWDLWWLMTAAPRETVR